MKKGVIFDFDGTLCLSFPLVVSKMVEAIEEFRNVPLTEEEQRSIMGPTEEGIINKIISDKGDAKKCFYRYLEKYYEFHDEMLKDFIPGIRKILEELNIKNIPVYLLTGRSKETTMISLVKLDAFKYFKCVYTGGLEGAVKTQRLKEICENHNLKPEDLIYVGDTISDVEQCKAVGVDIISVTYNDPSISSELEKINPNRVCKDVKELSDKINEFLNEKK